MIDYSAFFHGTDTISAESLLEHGISEGQLQSRDRGFFGEGFYMTTDPTVAANYGTAVLEVRPPEHFDVFDAGDHLDKLMVPERPEWWGEFAEWKENAVRDAEVWEIADTDMTEEEIVESAIDGIDPEHPSFDRLDYYPEATEWLESEGYDIAFWTDTEVVLLNYDVEISPHNEIARQLDDA